MFNTSNIYIFTIPATACRCVRGRGGRTLLPSVANPGFSLQLPVAKLIKSSPLKSNFSQTNVSFSTTPRPLPSPSSVSPPRPGDQMSLKTELRGTETSEKRSRTTLTIQPTLLRISRGRPQIMYSKLGWFFCRHSFWSFDQPLSYLPLRL